MRKAKVISWTDEDILLMEQIRRILQDTCTYLPKGTGQWGRTNDSQIVREALRLYLSQLYIQVQLLNCPTLRVEEATNPD